MSEPNNLIIVVSAPSGVGKTTVLQYLISQRQDLVISISATTRKPRLGERDGVDYYFISEQEFQSKIEKNEFIEYAKVHDSLYGTLRSELERLLKSNKHIILELDVQGMRSIKKLYPNSISVFMLPPSTTEMERRLRNRATEPEEKIKIRMERAIEEMKCRNEFDYNIVNYQVEQSAYDLNTIINAELLRPSRIRLDFEITS
ncbi:MAG: guanylate kinase [Candidatus Hydrogenedentes bacterium]|nr:guanylate kinase [Candidatus Hydrogenedentota bacterium]